MRFLEMWRTFWKLFREKYAEEIAAMYPWEEHSTMPGEDHSAGRGQ
jgi:hypothetical protein